MGSAAAQCPHSMPMEHRRPNGAPLLKGLEPGADAPRSPYPPFPSVGEGPRRGRTGGEARRQPDRGSAASSGHSPRLRSSSARNTVRVSLAPCCCAGHDGADRRRSRHGHEPETPVPSRKKSRPSEVNPSGGEPLVLAEVERLRQDKRDKSGPLLGTIAGYERHLDGGCEGVANDQDLSPFVADCGTGMRACGRRRRIRTGRSQQDQSP